MDKKLYLAKYFLIALLFCPAIGFGGVCETIWDGDAAMSQMASQPANNVLKLHHKGIVIGEITQSQLRAFYDAKEKIQRLVGLHPKFILCGDAVPNAFAMPLKDGAIVGVTYGMLKLVDGDEDMAATVIGHEVGHHIKNHMRQTQNNAIVVDLLSTMLGVYLESKIQPKYSVQGLGKNIASIGGALVSAKFSRDQEREADDLGFQFILDTGYSPEGAVRLSELLKKKGMGGGGLFFDTHPGWEERATIFKAKIAQSVKAQQLMAQKSTDRQRLFAEKATPATNGNKIVVALAPNIIATDDQLSIQAAFYAFRNKDYQGAAKYLKEPSENGSALAQSYLGDLYIRGLGVKKDHVEAARLFRLSANQGNAFGQANLGFLYASGLGVNKDYAEAVRLFRLSAEQGNAQGQANLGLSYAKGDGVNKDYSEAARLFRLSADQGNPLGQVNLGYLYNQGLGVNQDIAEAARLYRLSADQGDATAQANLGMLYVNGVGVNRDYAEAIRLFQLSVEQGNAAAQANLGLLYAKGEGVGKDYVEAARLFRLSANQGDALGQGSLGFLYVTGLGVNKDFAEAARLLLLSANQGEAMAQVNLGWMYARGDGVNKDDVEAARLFRLSADQGNALGQYSYGYVLLNGLGTSKNPEEGVAWIRKAAAQGHPNAIAVLKQVAP